MHFKSYLDRACASSLFALGWLAAAWIGTIAGLLASAIFFSVGVCLMLKQPGVAATLRARR